MPAERAPRRRIYMFFQLREQWNCQFLEEDLKTPLRRRVSFPDPIQMLEFAQRGGCVLSPEDREGFEHGLSIGPRRLMAQSHAGAICEAEIAMCGRYVRHSDKQRLLKRWPQTCRLSRLWPAKMSLHRPFSRW